MLRRTLGLAETAGVSVAIMAPTAAMALNCALAAAYAGPAVPLAFLAAFAIVGCVAFAFVTFARTYATPASVGEFNARGLGPRAGALSMWTLLLVYALFTAGSAAEFGSFATATVALAGRTIPWPAAALVAIVLVAYAGSRPARASSRTMLAIEGISVAAILVLCAVVVARGGAGGPSVRAFIPDVAHLGGFGLATVFALLSFAGFEGAAVLGAESRDATRTIPRALVASVSVSGVLYVGVAYAQSLGFGFDARGASAFAASSSPLGSLALRYAKPSLAIAVDLGATLSAFAATLASATAAARLLYAFASEGRMPAALGVVDHASGTPLAAFATVVACATLLVAGFARAGAGGSDTFAALGTIATLALVLVYAAVQVAALRLFAPRWNLVERSIPVVALVALAATFLANIVPIPAGGAAAYPYIVLIWILAGYFAVRIPLVRDSSEPM